MIRHGTICLVGRGPSVDGWIPPTGSDVAAISSGVFARLPRSCNMWIRLDHDEYYMQRFWEQRNAEQYPYLRWWDAVGDQTMVRHMSQNKFKRGFDPRMPQFPKEVRRMVRDALKRKNIKRIDATPQKYPNLHVWPTILDAPANLSPSGPFGMHGIRNSLMLAVQVAVRLRYRRLLFAGCDLAAGKMYDDMLRHLERMSTEAFMHGVAWSVSSERSRLSEFLPVYESSEVRT